jgi:hypothetical protein
MCKIAEILKSVNDHEIRTQKDNLRAMSYEGCRKILVSLGHMISSASPRERDAFYQETMQHLFQLMSQVGEWRLKIAKIQEEKFLDLPKNDDKVIH